MAYETIEVRIEADKVGVITLNRPKQLNALNDQLMNELGEALKAFDADEKIGCTIITGSEKAFAAGADIGAMAKYSFADIVGPDALGTDSEWGYMISFLPGLKSAGGTEEILRNMIGERVLGLAPEPRLDKGIPFSELRAKEKEAVA